MSYLEGQNARTRLLVISGLPEDVVRMSNSLAEASGLTSIGSLQKPLQLGDLRAIIRDQKWPRSQAPKPAADPILQRGCV